MVFKTSSVIGTRSNYRKTIERHNVIHSPRVYRRFTRINMLRHFLVNWLSNAVTDVESYEGPQTSPNKMFSSNHEDIIICITHKSN
jgi:hypothetical protein